MKKLVTVSMAWSSPSWQVARSRARFSQSPVTPSATYDVSAATRAWRVRR